jgi:hypothetical protein
LSLRPPGITADGSGSVTVAVFDTRHHQINRDLNANVVPGFDSSASSAGRATATAATSIAADQGATGGKATLECTACRRNSSWHGTKWPARFAAVTAQNGVRRQRDVAFRGIGAAGARTRPLQAARCRTSPTP